MPWQWCHQAHKHQLSGRWHRWVRGTRKLATGSFCFQLYHTNERNERLATGNLLSSFRTVLPPKASNFEPDQWFACKLCAISVWFSIWCYICLSLVMGLSATGDSKFIRLLLLLLQLVPLLPLLLLVLQLLLLPKTCCYGCSIIILFVLLAPRLDFQIVVVHSGAFWVSLRCHVALQQFFWEQLKRGIAAAFAETMTLFCVRCWVLWLLTICAGYFATVVQSHGKQTHIKPDSPTVQQTIQQCQI